MLTATGTAEFVFDNGVTRLRVRTAIQPHVPHEHDILANLGRLVASSVQMDHGQLILTANLIVPQHDLVKDLEQTPSSAPSDATSASDDSD